MNLKKGKVNNINKKLIASLAALTLVTTGLTGCSNVAIEDINYVVNSEDGTKSISGTVSYETLKYCGFYKVYNNKTDERYYTIALQDEYNGSYMVKYYDIFTGEQLNYSDYAFKSIDTVERYLVDLNMVKDKYTKEELQELLNVFINNQKVEKQLVKEK